MHSVRVISKFVQSGDSCHLAVGSCFSRHFTVALHLHLSFVLDSVTPFADKGQSMIYFYISPIMFSLHGTIQFRSSYFYTVCYNASENRTRRDSAFTGPCQVDFGLKNYVSGFGYLSEPDKCTDKQQLRDEANVMLKHFAKQS